MEFPMDSNLSSFSSSASQPMIFGFEDDSMAGLELGSFRGVGSDSSTDSSFNYDAKTPCFKCQQHKQRICELESENATLKGRLSAYELCRHMNIVRFDAPDMETLMHGQTTAPHGTMADIMPTNVNGVKTNFSYQLMTNVEQPRTVISTTSSKQARITDTPTSGGLVVPFNDHVACLSSPNRETSVTGAKNDLDTILIQHVGAYTDFECPGW